MINFYDFLKNEDEPLSAVIAWLEALESAGIHIRRAAIPQLINFGDKQDLISKIATHSYDSPQELIQEVSMEGYPIKCNRLLENPRPLGLHVDHERTYNSLTKMNKLRKENEQEEAIDYLKYLKEQGTIINIAPLRDLLPEKHKDLLANPYNALELNVACERLITRCKPSEHSQRHRDYPIFRLDGIWHNDRKLESYANNLGAIYTDTICDKCYQIITDLYKKGN